jgi:hypothetical protein
VLKAVGDVGSISAFSAVEDRPSVCGVAGVFMVRDNLGRLGGDDCRDDKDITVVCGLQGASMVVLNDAIRGGVISDSNILRQADFNAVKVRPGVKS